MHLNDFSSIRLVIGLVQGCALMEFGGTCQLTFYFIFGVPGIKFLVFEKHLSTYKSTWYPRFHSLSWSHNY